MTEQKQDFEIWAGDHRNLHFGVTGSDSGSQDLSGTCIVWILEQYAGSGSLIRKATGGNGVTISGSVYTVALSPIDTLELRGHYYHESQITDAASNVFTVAVGTTIINQSGI